MGTDAGKPDARAAAAPRDAAARDADVRDAVSSPDVSSSDAGTPAVDAAAAPSTGPFPVVTDFAAMGPFATEIMENVGPMNNYTVYRPAEPAPGGAKSPIVGWMSGGGTAPALYTLLPHLASHGFVVVAANTIPGIGTEQALGQEILAGIDWALGENGRSGSELFDKLDASKIASAGYSMGSLATFTIASDPRLITTVHISGGNMAPERVKNLRAPAAFICGTPGDSSCNILSSSCDIAAANCDTDFAGATTPVFYANFPAGHLGILSAPTDSRIAAMVAAWLRYQLMADTTLSAKFVGPGCTYCSDSNWKVQQKNLP